MVRQKISNYEQPIVRLIIVSNDDVVTASGNFNPFKTDTYDDGTWQAGTTGGDN